MLEDGKPEVGRFLYESSGCALSLDIILAAKSLEEFQKRARNMKAKTVLYSEWLKL